MDKSQIITTKPIDIRSWERFNQFISSHNKTQGRAVVITNARVKLINSSVLSESNVGYSEFKFIESFEINLQTGSTQSLDLQYTDDAQDLHVATLPVIFVIIDLEGLDNNKLAFLSSYFARLAIPVILYSGCEITDVDSNFLAKASCYCFIATNSYRKISVFKLLRSYIQGKVTVASNATDYNKPFSTRSFFDKVSQKWRGVVYGIQTKKRRKKRSWRKDRVTKRFNEFNKKKP